MESSSSGIVLVGWIIRSADLLAREASTITVLREVEYTPGTLPDRYTVTMEVLSTALSFVAVASLSLYDCWGGGSGLGSGGGVGGGGGDVDGSVIPFNLFFELSILSFSKFFEPNKPARRLTGSSSLLSTEYLRGL